MKTRILNRGNINQSISEYLKSIENIPLKIESKNILQFLTDIKRKKMEIGPYPHTTLFESANRIMSDLTILYGVKELLDGTIKEINFDEYKVELGNENKNSHDLEAVKGKMKLYGEGFNVADSYFNIKKYHAIKKLRGQANDKTILLLVYNDGAVSKNYKPKKENNVFHLKVKLKYWA